MGDLRRIVDRDAAFPRVVFVGQGSVEESRVLLADLWPEAALIADRDLKLFNHFGIKRGKLGQILGPSVWACGFRAMKRGARPGKPVGDPMLLPGALLFVGGELVATFEAKSASDAPDWEDWVAGSLGQHKKLAANP